MAENALRTPATSQISPRRRFLAALPDRLASLLSALQSLEADPDSTAKRQLLTRRLGAMADASVSLDLEQLAPAFTSAQCALERTGGQRQHDALAEVRQTLELVPTLAHDLVPPPESTPIQLEHADSSSHSLGVTSASSAPTTEPAASEPTASLSTASPSTIGLNARVPTPTDLKLEPIESDPLGNEGNGLADGLIAEASPPEHTAPTSPSPQPELGDDAPQPAALRNSTVVPPLSLDVRRPSIVIVLGVLPLRDSVRAWAKTETDVPFEFTVDLQDAQSLAPCGETPLFVVDARRRDAQPAIAALTEAASCVVVEASVTQKAQWQGTPHVSVVSAGGNPLPTISALLHGIAPGSMPTPSSLGALGAPPAAPTGAPSALAQPTDTAPMRHASTGRHDAPDVATLPNRRVLIADADPATAWFLSGVMKAAHADVMEARDGLEAWAIAQQWYPDLVVADVNLEGLDGFGLCRNIKRDVALGDVPVLLLAQKREELQRARELGARADAYLVKEAHAPVILRRCAEVLQSRADVEKRLRNEAKFHGRLDGMTPHSVLRLACDLVGEATVTFEDAGYDFLATIADGRLFNVKRRFSSGEPQDGAGAVAALLGMRAGRFCIERGCEMPQAAFSGSLSHALAPTLERTRRAMRIIQGDALHKIAHLEINRSNVAPYVEASPAVVQKIVSKLRAGVAPSALLKSISPGLLESVLTDVALRGGIDHAIAQDGTDLLEAPDLFAQPFDLDLRTPTGGFEMMAAPGAPLVGPRSSHEDAMEAARFAELNDPPSAPHQTAEVFDDRCRNLAADPAPCPSADASTTGTTSSNEAQPDAGVTTEGSAQSPAPAIAAEATANTPYTAGEQPAKPPASPATATPATAAPASAQGRADKRPEGQRAEQSTAPQPTPAPAELDLCDAIFSATSATPSTPARQDAGTGSDSSADQQPTGAAAGHARMDHDMDPEPPIPSEESAHTSTDTPLPPATASTPGSESAPVATRSVGRPSTSEQDTEPPSSPSEKHVTEEPAPSKLLVSDTLTESERLPGIDIDADDDPLFDSLVTGRGFADSSSVNLSPVRPERDQSVTSDDQPRKKPQSEVKTTPSLKRPPLRPPQRSEKPEKPERPRTTLADRLVAGAKKAGAWSAKGRRWRDGRAAQAKEISSRGPSKVRARASKMASAAKRSILPAAAVMGAATLTFSGMGWLVERLHADQDAPPQLQQPADGIAAHPDTLIEPSHTKEDAAEVNSVVAPPGSKPKGAQMQLTDSELPLPRGIEVAPGKGLLEINSGGKHKIYVEGVFVGRGPVRRVPLAAGPHQVTLRNDGEEVVSKVVVTAGKRTRLEPRTLAGALPTR